MIISTQNKIEYKQSDYVLDTFNNLLTLPFEKHSVTAFWQREVLASYKNKDFKTIREIVEGGQAKFDESFKCLTPEERVLVYCYDGNMQQHTVSQLYIFEKHADIFDKYLFNPNQQVLFVDFGCGPLSSGIALAMYYTESQKSNGQKLKFNYIGIDEAESMLLKAKEFSQYPNLFHKSTVFDFFNPYANDPHNFKKRLYDSIDSYISSNTLIILNFSYLFASSTIDASRLAKFIKEILAIYTCHEICLIFQNPPNSTGTNLNEKWDLFQSRVPDLSTAINGPLSENFDFYDLTNRRLRETKLYYDIRFRAM